MTNSDLALKTGSLIKLIRKEKNISQENFAIDANISRRHMSSVENGKIDIKLVTLKKICLELKISLPDFLARVYS